jgi:hypothetical protein
MPVRLPLAGSWAAAAAVLSSLPDQPARPPIDLVLQPWESIVCRRIL